MDLVPVIDLQAGRVVRAARGERATYRPLVTPLAEGCEPVPVARALLERAASRRLYVADLDAIVEGRPQRAAIDALLAALPDIELWLDAGFAGPQAAALARWPARVTPVFGSESLRVDALPREAILSLDRRGEALLDPAGWWRAPDRWPTTVIVMSLDAVGAGAGPDLATLADVRRRAPTGTRLVGAGGVRDEADLGAAAAAGAEAWLVASALHAQAIDRRANAARA